MIGNQLLTLNSFVLAQQSRLEAMGDGLRNKGEAYTTTELLIGAGAIAVAGITIWFILQRLSERKSRRTNSPRKLFRELCAAHGLDRKDRKLLLKVTRWQRMTNPGRLFVEPVRFESVNLSPSLCKQHERLTALRNRLFALPAADQPQSN